MYRRPIKSKQRLINQQEPNSKQKDTINLGSGKKKTAQQKKKSIFFQNKELIEIRNMYQNQAKLLNQIIHGSAQKTKSTSMSKIMKTEYQATEYIKLEKQKSTQHSALLKMMSLKIKQLQEVIRIHQESNKKIVHAKSKLIKQKRTLISKISQLELNYINTLKQKEKLQNFFQYYELGAIQGKKEKEQKDAKIRKISLSNNQPIQSIQQHKQKKGKKIQQMNSNLSEQYQKLREQLNNIYITHDTLLKNLKDYQSRNESFENQRRQYRLRINQLQEQNFKLRQYQGSPNLEKQPYKYQSAEMEINRKYIRLIQKMKKQQISQLQYVMDAYQQEALKGYQFQREKEKEHQNSMQIMKEKCQRLQSICKEISEITIENLKQKLDFVKKQFDFYQQKYYLENSFSTILKQNQDLSLNFSNILSELNNLSMRSE